MSALSAVRHDRASPKPGDPLRELVREIYAQAATAAATAIPGPRVACCAPHSGLGCGSPTTFAALQAGESVLDLGCGAGFDCLAAALEVGRRGRVVGLDMTPEMVRLARRHAVDAAVPNVTIVQGEIESLPFPDATFDVVISNCVINLCTDKWRVLAEACRVLKPNGRLAIADIVAVAPLPAGMKTDLALGCVAGAMPIDELSRVLGAAGFTTWEITIGEHSTPLIEDWAPDLNLKRYIAAANIKARKERRYDPAGHLSPAQRLD